MGLSGRGRRWPQNFSRRQKIDGSKIELEKEENEKRFRKIGLELDEITQHLIEREIALKGNGCSRGYS